MAKVQACVSDEVAEKICADSKSTALAALGDGVHHITTHHASRLYPFNSATVPFIQQSPYP
ncbi:hypothetical protein ACQFN5_29645 (plasmid) [Klebsiella sp. WOUb02]|uniref:hypothetical protein n=1 Tax=Klebsiella sp. WOUb02 TaxID=3161071 RepID=UPI003CEEDC3B